MSLDHQADEDGRAVISHRAMDLAVSIILFVAAVALGWDNWQLGAGWASDGPEAGYFPFYLCVLLGIASAYGIFKAWISDPTTGFVGRTQFKRVLQVALPSILFVAGIQFLGMYVSSFLLILGFMHFLGGSSWIKSLLTAAIFVVLTFYVFEKQFTVLLPKGPIERAILY